jgi:tetratricopeptide (TPR) repeat protein/DNA-binding CsgD family transcriptional regulator
MYLGNMDSSYYYHQKTKDLAEILKDKLTLGVALSDIGNYHGMKGNYEESFDTYENAIKMFKEVKDLVKVGVTIGQLGSIHMDRGNYRIAQGKFVEALKILDTLDTKPYMEADIIRKIGHIQFNLKNYEESIEYYGKALNIYLETDDNVFASEALIDIGASYLDLNKNNTAIENFEKSIKLAEKYNIEGTAAIAYSNLGGAFTKIKDFDKARYYLTKSLDYHKKRGFANNNIEVHRKMADLYLAMSQPKNSLVYANRAVKIADSVGAINYQLSSYLLRSQVHEKLEDTELALKDIKSHNIFKDSIYNQKKTQQIEELKTIYETEKKEAALALQEEEIKTLNQKVEISNLRKGLYAGGMASALALFGLSVFGYRQRIKKNRIEREKQEEIYKQEIEYKKKELASQTLHLVQKNTFIQELMENLQSIKNDPERFKVEFRRIVMLLKKENASDKDWEVFKSYFAVVHNDFDQKLKTFYSDISEKEIRLAAFLRMNLTTKEIAATLNVLPDSILKSKYRLKKKLSLDKETDLASFLNTL